MLLSIQIFRKVLCILQMFSLKLTDIPVVGVVGVQTLIVLFVVTGPGLQSTHMSQGGSDDLTCS